MSQWTWLDGTRTPMGAVFLDFAFGRDTNRVSYPNKFLIPAGNSSIIEEIMVHGHQPKLPFGERAMCMHLGCSFTRH